MDLEDVYFLIPIHSDSQKYVRFVYKNKVLSVLETSLWSKHSSPGIHSSVAHCSQLSSSSRDIGITISQRLVSLPHRPSGTTLPLIRATEDAQDGRLHTKS